MTENMKMTSINLRLLFHPSFEKSLEEQEGEMKYILEIFFKHHFWSSKALYCLEFPSARIGDSHILYRLYPSTFVHSRFSPKI